MNWSHSWVLMVLLIKVFVSNLCWEKTIEARCQDVSLYRECKVVIIAWCFWNHFKLLRPYPIWSYQATGTSAPCFLHSHPHRSWQCYLIDPRWRGSWEVLSGEPSRLWRYRCWEAYCRVGGGVKHWSMFDDLFLVGDMRLACIHTFVWFFFSSMFVCVVSGFRTCVSAAARPPEELLRVGMWHCLRIKQNLDIDSLLMLIDIQVMQVCSKQWKINDQCGLRCSKSCFNLSSIKHLPKKDTTQATNKHRFHHFPPFVIGSGSSGSPTVAPYQAAALWHSFRSVTT